MVLQPNYLTLFICGAVGAFTKDVLKDNKLSLPHIKDGYIYLGCIGGIIIGALAGYLVDNDPVTAFLGGYAGSEIIKSLVSTKISVDTETTVTHKITDTVVKTP